MEPRAKKVVLVVDDDAQIRSGLEAGLELRGYQVATASNGRHALAWLDTHRPDLIVLDVVMPELDGLCFVGEVRRRCMHSGVPILGVSSDRDAQDGLAELGVAAFLPKPFRLTSFLEEVARLVGD